MSKKNTKQNKKFRLNPLAVVALVICALAVVYCATTAWLTGEPLNPLRLTTLQDFDYDMKVYFEGADSAVVDTANGVNPTGAITVDYTDPSAENYVGKLRVEIKQNGNGVAFARVRVSHEWLTSSGDRLQGDAYLPYTVNSEDFADNRNSDGYIYHDGAMEANGDYVTVINGFDSASFDASAVSSIGNVTLSVNVSVDAVQFNRYQQIWGISSRPW